MRRRLAAGFLVAALAVAGSAAPAAAATPTCEGERATIVGTAGANRLIGTPGDDVIVGLGGPDRIEGRGGDDRICAGTGHDVVFGGPGTDWVWGGGGNDRIGGYTGYDFLYGEAGADELYGTGGGDFLSGGTGHDRLDGGEHRDYLFGGEADDVLLGREGDDVLEGDAGEDQLYGGDGKDRQSGGRGRDHIHGGPGRDRMELTSPGVGVHLDLVSGEFTTVDGAETVAAIEDVVGTPGDDVLKGDAGPNRFFAEGGYDRTEGRAGDDQLDGEVVLGGAGDDRLPLRLYGSGVRRSAFGGPGDDFFSLRGGCRTEADCELEDIRFAGGSGTDLIRVNVWDERDPYPRPDERLRFDLPAGTVTSLDSGLVINARDFEQVIGGDNDDTIIGTTGPNLLMGGPGDDTIRGGGGDDVLAGGGPGVWDEGSDTMDAGPGAADVCHTSSPPHGDGPQDTITRCEIFRRSRSQ